MGPEELWKKAQELYFSDWDDGSLMFAARSSGVENHQGIDYAVMRNVNGILSVIAELDGTVEWVERADWPGALKVEDADAKGWIADDVEMVLRGQIDDPDYADALLRWEKKRATRRLAYLKGLSQADIEEDEIALARVNALLGEVA